MCGGAGGGFGARLLDTDSVGAAAIDGAGGAGDPDGLVGQEEHRECGEVGIRANVVSPGPTWTVLSLAGQRFPDDYLTDLGSSARMGRVAQPQEVAPAYVYLASDADSSFTVGEVIAVTGGLTDTR